MGSILECGANAHQLRRGDGIEAAFLVRGRHRCGGERCEGEGGESGEGEDEAADFGHDHLFGRHLS